MNYDQIKRARLTGMLYLLVIIFAGFSQGYVRGTLYIPTDPASTLDNINTFERLFRLGLVSDLTAFLLDAVISILLYQLLKPTHKNIAILAATFRLLAHPAIASINLLNHHLALQVASGNGYLTAMGTEQREIWTMFFMNAHHVGYLLAGAFFAVHCALLGLLLYRSFAFPKILGILMLFAAAGYALESFGYFIAPGNELLLATIVGVAAAIGEVSLTLYLLTKGMRAP